MAGLCHRPARPARIAPRSCRTRRAVSRLSAVDMEWFRDMGKENGGRAGGNPAAVSPASEFAGISVCMAGLGVSGPPAARTLAALGARVTAVDSRADEPRSELARELADA